MDASICGGRTRKAVTAIPVPIASAEAMLCVCVYSFIGKVGTRGEGGESFVEL